MNQISSQELEQLFSSRGAIYQLLARVYRVEVDQTFLAQLQQLALAPDPSFPDIAEGNRLLKTFMRQVGEDTLDDLAVNYAKIFLGVGPVGGKGAFPYESVYTSQEGLLMQQARDEVLALYESEGLSREEGYVEPEDHLAFELIFMAFLCQKSLEAIRGNDEGALSRYVEKQRAFLREHLLRWVPRFCADVEPLASTDLYKAMASITRGFLLMDREVALASEELV